MFFVIAISAVICVSAQNKILSSKQLMDRDLYPAHPMWDFQFVGNTDQIAYIKDSTLYVGPADAPKPCITLGELNRALLSSVENTLSSMPRLQFIDDKTFKFIVAGNLMTYNISTRKITKLLTYNIHSKNVDIAPGLDKFARTRSSNLYVSCNGKTFAIEEDSPDVVIGQSVHRNEFGIEKGTFWSPKGNLLAFYKMDQSMVTDYPLVNTTSRIARVQPFKYPMAGMKSHEVTIGIYNPDSASVIYLQSRKNESVEECENYLTNITWSPNEKFLYVAKINRAQNHMWLERYNAATGELDGVLFEEENPRYVEPVEGLYFPPNHEERFLWLSMRDGYKHIYLYRTDGTLLRQLTSGPYEVEGIIGFDSKGDHVFVYANKDNLAGRAAYKINIRNGEMTRITPSEGTHSVVVNAAGNLFIDTYSSTDTPAKTVVLDAKGRTVNTIYDSPNPLADYAMPGIKLGTIKAADGKTDLYYRLITPPNMEKGKKYPTLVYVYGGPHSQLVTDSWMAGGNLYFTFLAQHGYVVFTLDNRGTDNRGFEFESCIHRQLGTVEMADQMEGVKFLKSLPYVDPNRMGVEGWSFGGFMTITMKLAHPEVFKVACAGGPVIDWKWYEVMYGERYMDTPMENPTGYENNSLINKADQLQGRLLVIHGAEDNTVVWQNSIEFIEACIKAGKQVDYFIYPHHEHNVRGPERVHLYEKMFDYYESFL